ncbi:MAG: sulfite exporter TauE/SafE family protein [Ignavibacteria bacterium]
MIELVISIVASSIIGIAIGLLGAGGSILVMPVLVYVLGISPLIATTYSLGIVGISSAIAAIRNAREQQTNWKVLFTFAIPAIISIMIMRAYIMPALPKVLELGMLHISIESLSMIILSLLMLISAQRMMSSKELQSHDIQEISLMALMFTGLMIGVLTGFTGIGGGFLIVPAMILIGHMNVKEAAFTSMILIAMNALPGFFVDILNGKNLEWGLFTLLTIASVFGGYAGIMLSKRIRQDLLRISFGIIIALLALFILIKELT